MIILINSSKTMVSRPAPRQTYRPPQLLEQAKTLDGIVKQYSATQLAGLMHLSKPLADKTHQLIANWTAEPNHQTLALDSFAGDIYRGLRAGDFSPADRQQADRVLIVLSGLYGAIRPLDSICPYRLELAYRLKTKKFKDLYDFWQAAVADCLPKDGPIINLASQEYMRVVAPYIDTQRVIAPRFLTAAGTPGHQTFVVIHAKVARGAFARWLIKERIEDLDRLPEFSDLDYVFSAKMSTPTVPTFIRPPLNN